MDLSPLQKMRLKYRPKIPDLLRDLAAVSLKAQPMAKNLSPAIQRLFPKTFSQTPFVLTQGNAGKARALKVGVVFSGGQAAGGHNVIGGLYDALMKIDPKSELIGFLDGPSGIIQNKKRTLSGEEIAFYRNQGGFDLIGSGRTKIEKPEDFQAALKNAGDFDGLVIIGGDDSNTNAALLAEYFLEHGSRTRVVGVPKTIDGDLRSEDIEISFGFDSACKTYSELIGNIERDALSAKKYYHCIKLMGRSASHIALECALQTRPNLTLIGEEGKTMAQIVDEIADLVKRRKAAGKEYGVILIPEGLVEFMPEIKKLIQELSKGGELSSESAAVFADLPEKVQKQLQLERDPHGNVQVSLIETELILIEKVKKKLEGKFNAVQHFLGYEGRSCLPSNFDASYCYALGLFTALCIRDGLTGVISSIQKLKGAIEQWHLKAVPIVDLIHFEIRKGKEKPVIQKSLVDINGKAFLYFSRLRKSWEVEDRYISPGPIQFFGEAELTDSVPITLE
ncbi:MAG: diphosphate--fructose-6-phosphate 1-phosphotransferase [Verrucomicrobia bacterium]|nr:diphosphate--fructose-6-phosphate 1-phosphotransferase [Verrucomicrobiota bacterium]